MPPRFAYWTILIDNAPTAFRARDAQELLPTLAQLKRTNDNVVLKWFAGGRLWDSPEAARDARRRPPVVEKRGADWRPGGQHRDPRARFDKKRKPKPNRDQRGFKPHGTGSFRPKPHGTGFKPKPHGSGFGPKPHGAGSFKPKPPGMRSFKPKPPGTRGFQPRDQRHAKPGGSRPPWRDRNRAPGGPPRPPRQNWRAPHKKRDDNDE